MSHRVHCYNPSTTSSPLAMPRNSECWGGPSAWQSPPNLPSNHSSINLERVYFSMLGIKNVFILYVFCVQVCYVFCVQVAHKAGSRRMQVYLQKLVLSKQGAHLLPSLRIILVFAFCNFLAKWNLMFFLLFFFSSLSEDDTERMEQMHVLFVCCWERVPGKEALFWRTEIHRNTQQYHNFQQCPEQTLSAAFRASWPSLHCAAQDMLPSLKYK